MVGQAITLAAFASHKNAPLLPHGTAWARTQLNVATKQPWGKLGYTYRSDYRLTFNKAAALFYHEISSGKTVSDGLNPAFLQAWHLEAQGVFFEHTWPVGEYGFVRPRLNLLRGTNTQSGRLDGVLGAEDGELAGHLDIDYLFTRDLLLDYQTKAVPAGYGYGFDFVVGWDSPERYVALAIEDVVGFLDWRNISYTQGKLDSFRQNSSDSMQLQALLSGKRGEQHHKQRLLSYKKFDYLERFEGYSLGLQLESFAHKYWYQQKLYKHLKSTNIFIGYEGRDRQWLIGWQEAQGRWGIEYGADHWQIKKSQSLSLLMHYHWRW